MALRRLPGGEPGRRPKWGGSFDTLFALAQQVTDQAPEGHSVHAFVRTVHFERWIYFGWGKDATAADRQG